jgi:DNA-binding IclR family transcriptional regulator
MDSSVKSAARVMQILELLDALQREASVMEVSRALGFPQSSTSMLLKTLVTSGYLQYQSSRRTFVPTAKLARLGAWAAPMLEPDRWIIAAMEDVSKQTGETVILGMLAGTQVCYVHVIPAIKPLHFHVTVGTMRPLAMSGMGRLFMAQMAPERVRDIVQAYNDRAGPDEIRPSLASILRRLASIRMQDYNVSVASLTRGAGVVAVPLFSKVGRTPLALGIGAPERTVRERCPQWVALMRRLIAHHARKSGDEGRAIP